nr:MAG TPA: hypothetical protein [Caudoviricetes sp.]
MGCNLGRKNCKINYKQKSDHRAYKALRVALFLF